MAFVSNRDPYLNRRVRLKIPVQVMAGTFQAGTEMTITGMSQRGLDLVDDKGNQLLETGMLGYNFFEYID